MAELLTIPPPEKFYEENIPALENEAELLKEEQRVLMRIGRLIEKTDSNIRADYFADKEKLTNTKNDIIAYFERELGAEASKDQRLFLERYIETELGLLDYITKFKEFNSEDINRESVKKETVKSVIAWEQSAVSSLFYLSQLPNPDQAKTLFEEIESSLVNNCGKETAGRGLTNLRGNLVAIRQLVASGQIVAYSSIEWDRFVAVDLVCFNKELDQCWLVQLKSTGSPPIEMRAAHVQTVRQQLEVNPDLFLHAQKTEGKKLIRGLDKMLAHTEDVRADKNWQGIEITPVWLEVGGLSRLNVLNSEILRPFQVALPSSELAGLRLMPQEGEKSEKKKKR